jgi:hypothetical protein
MNCREYDTRIGDYVDGTLDERARAALEAHLSTCAQCRAVVADLEVIRTASLALESQVPPPQVWTKLSAAIEAEPQRFPAGWGLPGGRWWHTVPAAAMLTLVVGLSWIGGRLVPVAEQGRLASVSPAPVAEPASIAAEYHLAEEHFTTAIEGLERIAAEDRGQLDMETRDVFQANMTVLDGAIVESRAALKTEPENDVAQESLFEALRSKVALLQDIIALINEMRKGNQEGAARIVSGLNQ